MVCRICSCIFDGTRFIMLPNVYNWESPINVIDSRIVMGIAVFRDICLDCYQKLENFIAFRQRHMLDVKCKLEYPSTCAICKNIVPNGTVLTEQDWSAQRPCIRTLLPNMIFNAGNNLYLCHHCLAVSKQFNQFWQMFLSNTRPLPIQENDTSDQNCSHLNEDFRLAMLQPPKVEIKSEPLDINIKDENIFHEVAEEEGEEAKEKQTNEEMTALKFTVKITCYITGKSSLDLENSDFIIRGEKFVDNNVGTKEIDIKEGMPCFSAEEASFAEKDTKPDISDCKIEEHVFSEESTKSKTSETCNGKHEPLYDKTTMRTDEYSTTDYNGSLDKDASSLIINTMALTEDNSYIQDTKQETDCSEPNDSEDLTVEEHDPRENAHKNFRVRSEKPEEAYKIPFMCIYCPEQFAKQADLLEHCKKEHKSQPIRHRCPLCDFTTSTRKYLTRHYHYNHKTDFVLHGCHLCAFQTKRPGHLKAHLNKHYGTVVHRCPSCDFVTKWPFSLKCHVLAKHDTSSKHLACPKCPYRTKFANELNKHAQYKHNKEHSFLKCPKCPFTSHFQAWLNKHIRCQHPDVERVYKCDRCPFESRLRTSLRKHEKTMHSDGKTVYYECELCDHRTKYKGNLKTHHALKHETDAQMVHCARCAFKTRLRGDLAKHLRYTHGNAPRLRCPHCQHATARASHLREHVRLQHGEGHKVYKCDRCEHVTKYEANLRQHRRLLHGGDATLYGCEMCQHKTMYRYNLKGHYRACHGMAGVVLDEKGRVRGGC